MEQQQQEEGSATEDSDSLSEPPTYEQVIREHRDAGVEIPLRENPPYVGNSTRENPEIAAARRNGGFHPRGEDRCEGGEDAARFLESLASTAASAAAAPRLFGGMPAVRWNRNMQVNRWTSLPSWVAS